MNLEDGRQNLMPTTLIQDAAPWGCDIGSGSVGTQPKGYVKKDYSKKTPGFCSDTMLEVFVTTENFQQSKFQRTYYSSLGHFK